MRLTKKRIVVVAAIVAAGTGAAAAYAATRSEPAMSRDLTVMACPDTDGDTSNVLTTSADYPPGAGYASPTEALRSVALRLQMPAVPDRAVVVERNSRHVRFEIPGPQAVFLADKSEDKWLVSKYSICEATGKALST